MKKLFTTLLLLLPLALNSAVIDFTGGTVIFGDETLENTTTNGEDLFFGIKRYEENGFFLEYVLTEGISDWSSQSIGNYYGDPEGNDVIHGHWPTEWNNFEGLDYIKIGKIDGGLFDLEYFALTSNTEVGGGHATGEEQVFIQGFKSNFRSLWMTEEYKIPSDNWGNETYNVFLGDDFNEIEYALISGTNSFCFGMDEFTFDEIATAVGTNGINLTTGATGPSVPEPSTYSLFLAFCLFIYVAICERNGNQKDI